MSENGLADVTLENLAEGAALELFDREFQEVLDNIQDPNTKASAKRTITVKVTVAPHEGRESGQCFVEVSSKLAPPVAASSMIYMGQRNGRFVARSNDVRQKDMFGPDDDDGVTPINPDSRSAQ